MEVLVRYCCWWFSGGSTRSATKRKHQHMHSYLIPAHIWKSIIDTYIWCLEQSGFDHFWVSLWKVDNFWEIFKCLQLPSISSCPFFLGLFESISHPCKPSTGGHNAYFATGAQRCMEGDPCDQTNSGDDRVGWGAVESHAASTTATIPSTRGLGSLCWTCTKKKWWRLWPLTLNTINGQSLAVGDADTYKFLSLATPFVIGRFQIMSVPKLYFFTYILRFYCAFHSNFGCLEKPSPLGYPYVKWTESRKALKNEHSKLLLVCFWIIGLGWFSVVRLFAPFSAPFVADVIAACDIHCGGPWSATSNDRMPCTTSFVEWWSVRWRD